MADQSVIDQVKANIPSDAAEDDWTDEFIGGLLDSGASISRVTLSFWQSRVAKLSTVVDVSESGSSRQLSNLFNQAKIAYDMWLEAVKLEDRPPLPQRPSIAFHKLKRV